jgi:hypothetical protein
LLGSQAAFIIGLLDKRGRSLDPLYVAKEDRVSSLGHLARTLELMDLEPVLLETSLGAVLYGFSLAFGTTVERYELLIILIFSVLTLHKSGALILFGCLFKRTHIIFTLAYMNNFIIWRLRNLLILYGSLIAIEIVFKMRGSVI